MNKKRFQYINSNKAIEIHDYLVKDGDGLGGIKDQGRLESILEHIQNDDYYPSIFDKVAHLVFGITVFHVFNDGNKRTALALGAFFLGLNYSDALAEKFIVEMENIVVDVARGLIDQGLLKEIIQAVFFEDIDAEILLFKIYKALEAEPVHRD